MSRLGIALAAALSLAVVQGAAAAELFVTTSGDDANDGLSWASALGDPGTAVEIARSSPGPDTIHVAAGLYRLPATLDVAADTRLLGGYPPAGGASRDPSRNPSVLDFEGRGIVRFDDGADRTVLDGFVVKHGGPGIHVTNAGPVIKDCLVEANGNWDQAWTGGIQAEYDRPCTPLRIENCTLRRNMAVASHSDFVQFFASGLSVQSTIDLGTFVSGLVVQGNGSRPEWERRPPPPFFPGGGPSIRIRAPSGRLEHVFLSDNEDEGGTLWLAGAIDLFNVATPCTRAETVDGRTSATSLWQNVTVAERSSWAPAMAFGARLDTEIRDGILWGRAPGAASDQLDATNSIVFGGWPGGTNVLVDDPLFAEGPLCDWYLSEIAASQPATSPGVDAGSVLASDLGLDLMTTRTDVVTDTAVVDLGWHAPPTRGRLRILRGVHAGVMTPLAFAEDLPYTDTPGILHEMWMPLLFYWVPGSTRDIVLTVDPAGDAVVIDWR